MRCDSKLSDMGLRIPRQYLPRDFVYKVASTPSELEGFWNLRTAIFCEEQGLFLGHDRDEHDLDMIPIVCVSLIMGMPDRVVGVVRIDHREPGVWWGGRLGVDPAFRRIDRVSPSVAQRNRHPASWISRSIGAGLILKAVSTANALGCHTFLAHVQAQNARLFEHLHWTRLAEYDLHGQPHVEMQADLAFYPAGDVQELADCRVP